MIPFDLAETEAPAVLASQRRPIMGLPPPPARLQPCAHHMQAGRCKAGQQEASPCPPMQLQRAPVADHAPYRVIERVRPPPNHVKQLWLAVAPKGGVAAQQCEQHYTRAPHIDLLTSSADG